MKARFILISLISLLSIASLYLISSNPANQYQNLQKTPKCFSFDGQLIPDPPTFEHPEVEVGFFAQNRCSQSMRFKFISSKVQEETVCLKQYEDDLIHMFFDNNVSVVEERC
ncbi:transmembrane protein, putative (macronuclear) [Tetrahymena thermophila SB210]|uniref:Transmembrane protein, putative n=1 Tax=Tetrahymena thermophila (strain SB210) TaxID=312017 RepID=Q229S6_TETTS|nr:transmembrane protein, putative [Tetrahymena thermophila SB210]EAR82049.1 transmembrane protein, putative [Tetrahymena thermophila SB210]|eukprot:XP_001029712.1 transmembrane protein, putative [Tetrahymena thermophila SB210]